MSLDTIVFDYEEEWEEWYNNPVENFEGVLNVGTWFMFLYSTCQEKTHSMVSLV